MGRIVQDKNLLDITLIKIIVKISRKNYEEKH